MFRKPTSLLRAGSINAFSRWQHTTRMTVSRGTQQVTGSAESRR